MAKYYVGSEIVNREIKSEISKFISSSDLLNEIQKKQLIEELNGRNCEESKADHSNLINALDYHYHIEWKKTTLNEVEFYKQVCIENSKINNEPYKVAEKSLEEFKKTFDRE
jgi:hypothetical protein